MLLLVEGQQELTAAQGIEQAITSGELSCLSHSEVHDSVTPPDMAMASFHQ
jgi:hypothetical protein